MEQSPETRESAAKIQIQVSDSPSSHESPTKEQVEARVRAAIAELAAANLEAKRVGKESQGVQRAIKFSEGQPSEGVRYPPPPPVSHPFVNSAAWPMATPERTEKLYAAKQLIEQAQLMGSEMTMAEALHLINEERRDAAQNTTPQSANRFRTPTDRLLYIERSLPSYDGTTLVSDFVFKFGQKLAQQSVVDAVKRQTLLISKLEGKAFTAVRANPSLCTSYADTMAFLKETYGQSVAGIKAQLLGLKFHPKTETVREFNERFNTIAAGAPVGTISTQDIGQYYIQAIGRGDDMLMRDIIWGTDLGRTPIAEVQRLVIDKLDSYSIYSSQAVPTSDTGAPASAYRPINLDDTMSTTASDVATATSSIGQLMKDLQDMKNAQLPKPQPAATAPAPAATGSGMNSSSRWQETRTCHICKKVGHISPNCPEKQKRAQMVSKAVGYVLDHIDQQGLGGIEQQPVQYVGNVVGCNMPAYASSSLAEIRNTAAQALINWDRAPTSQGKQQALAGFAGAIAQYCAEHPTEEKALYYLSRVEGLGQDALEEMMLNGDSALATKILAERRVRSVSTQAGDRGVPADLWPGISEMLGNLPAKTNVFEWLKESQMFCINVIELAMEIVLDKGWPINFQKMYEEIAAARENRVYGQYAADKRAQERLHAEEQARIASAKDIQMLPEQPQKRQSRWDQPGTAQIQQLSSSIQASVVPVHATASNSYSFEAARAHIEQEFGECEDLTSLAGPPTPHHVMQVVLLFDGRAVKVTAIRDTGAPDTIMTQALYRHLNLRGHTETSKNFLGLGVSSPTSYLGIYKPLVMRITPRIKITHQCFISPDRYCLLILGNDIFNKEVIETLSQNDQVGCYLLRYGNVFDVLPYKQLSIEERQRREKAYEQDTLEQELRAREDAKAKELKAHQGLKALVLQDEPAGYERSAELLVATKLARQAIEATQYPQVPPALGGMMREAVAEAGGSSSVAANTEDDVAYLAYQEALREQDPSFL